MTSQLDNLGTFMNIKFQARIEIYILFECKINPNLNTELVHGTLQADTVQFV